MAQVVGSVDNRGRPLVRLPAIEDDLLLMIDTGFNGDLMLSRAGAKHLGLAVSGETTSVELGDGSSGYVYTIQMTIEWLSVRRTIDVLVPDIWRPTGDDPVGLIGTKLLTPHLLLVDFASRTVEIETGE